MTTNIPPHNLREVIDATICVIRNKDAELDDIMEYIKGPDFPTRGIIMGRAGIRAAYATGRGRVYVRARTEIEEFKEGRTASSSKSCRIRSTRHGSSKPSPSM
jgi:DNA gyrase subunit A